MSVRQSLDLKFRNKYSGQNLATTTPVSLFQARLVVCELGATTSLAPTLTRTLRVPYLIYRFCILATFLMKILREKIKSVEAVTLGCNGCSATLSETLRVRSVCTIPIQYHTWRRGGLGGSNRSDLICYSLNPGTGEPSCTTVCERGGGGANSIRSDLLVTASQGAVS